MTSPDPRVAPLLPAGTGPLAGIKILEVGTMLAGPYATMMLADLGAEVTKIEPPAGDISRQVGDSYFASLNRGKRSVCLELATDDGRRRLGELVAESHALLVNLKPSAIIKLGLTYDALRVYNEKIVCVALTGFGLYGGDDPAFDYVVQAATGIAALTGDPDGPPTLPGYSSADNSAGSDRGAGAVGADHLGPRRSGRCVPARRAALAAELPRVGISQRRCDAAAPAQRCALVLRSRATVSDRRRVSGVVHHPRRILANLCRRGRHHRLSDDGRARGTARGGTRRGLAAALATTPPPGGRTRLKPLGIPAAAVRTLPEALDALPEIVVSAGEYRLVGSSIRVGGYRPDYRSPPTLGEHGPHPAETHFSAQKSE